MLLELKDIKVNYGKAEALRDISLQVDLEEIITLIGANGAGKTTALKAISGMIIPISGEIWFQGKRIDGKKPYSLVGLGIAHVPEGRRVFTSMSVLENLEMGAFLRKDKRAIARDMDNLYEHLPILKERRSQKAGSLSGGEQQMLAIGRALMTNPKLLLMDEPSSGLSPIMVEEIGTIIKSIKRLGVSIVLVEQNAQLAFSLSSRVYVLEVGRITLEGNTVDLLKDERIAKAYLS